MLISNRKPLSQNGQSCGLYCKTDRTPCHPTTCRSFSRREHLDRYALRDGMTSSWREGCAPIIQFLEPTAYGHAEFDQDQPPTQSALQHSQRVLLCLPVHARFQTPTRRTVVQYQSMCLIFKERGNALDDEVPRPDCAPHKRTLSCHTQLPPLTAFPQRSHTAMPVKRVEPNIANPTTPGPT